LAKKNLVIVESPAKAKTIQKYLGRGYTVKASMGHVRDLPKSKLGVDIENNFAPTYTTLRGRADTLKKLRAAAKDVDMVYLAPDPDREGEAIAWHVAAALKLPESKIQRVTFNEITERAIKEAFQHPRDIDMAKVNAQQARRILDRIVGYQLSPLLWKKVAKGLSAGRVQSVAVRLIVDREREIQAFVPVEFWEIAVQLSPDGGESVRFGAQLAEWQGAAFKVSKGDEALAIAEALRKADYTVEGVERKDQSIKPGPPFITSTLQQAASTHLRFAARRTMRIAQQLYEGIDVGGDEGSVGLITYMRTDSVRMADEAVGEARELIGEQYGPDYLPESARTYKSKKSAQEGHEAVRPTSAARTPEQMKQYLSEEQFKLYDLIWRRFMACQMANAKYEATDVRVRAAEGMFKARGRVCVFDGYTKLYGAPKEKDLQDLPALTNGQALQLLELDPTQHFTKPPSRYSEASLVRTLEREGIGRPSTYAAIISTVQDRGYVKQEKRAFHATDLGMVVTDLLLAGFPRIMDVQFTSAMEEKLDRIEDEDRDWVTVLKEFYEVFKENLEKAEVELKSVKGAEVEGEVCPECGKPMLQRWSKFGPFLGCSGYPECKVIKGDRDDDEAEKLDLACEKCGKPMTIKMGRRGKFIACTGYPDCRNTLKLGHDGKPVPPPEPTDELCEKCNSPMVIRTGARGRFVACTGFPKCRNTRALPTGIACPKGGCDGELIYKRGKGRGRKGFFGCTKYPDCDYTAAELPTEDSEQPSEASDPEAE
jgi:DNA topoisomerase I